MAATFTESFGRFTRSPGFKFFLICGLILLLSIPLAIVWFLVDEREGRANEARKEIAEHWGAAQRIQGPFLVVPYTVKSVSVSGGKQYEEFHDRAAVFLPDTFLVLGNTATEVRRRSIYDTTVYTAKLKLQAHYNAPDIRLVDQNVSSVHWQDATIVLGVTDVSGLKESASLVVDGNRRMPFEPSSGVPGDYAAGINARLYPAGTAEIAAAPTIDVDVDLVLAGSSTLSIAPVGRETRMELKSDWPHPSFVGAFLPESRDLRADGFGAVWRVPHLARSVPQQWGLAGTSTGGNSFDRFTPHVFGVSFMIPVDYFNLVNRAAKYGLMFLSVAFLAVFTLELTSDRRVHPVQYIFAGLAMTLFYVLLLSFSEHIGFTPAYFLASAATGGMLSLYVGKALQSTTRGLIMLCIFLILYILLYLILRLEDYALLAGAIAGFVMLTITMFATLRVNWSGGDAAAQGN